MRWREMTQLVKSLVCKRDELSLIPSTQVKSWALQRASVIPALEEIDEPLEPLDLMVSPRFSERPFSKYKTMSN